MLNWFGGLFDRIFAVVGALVATQFPMFIQQYGHQLTGRVAELRLQVDAIARAAQLGNKAPNVYIQRFLNSGDPDFIRQGEIMQLMEKRYEMLSEALHRLMTASPLERPWAFIRDFNWDVARLTYADFQPGIPFTLEAIIYAFVGLGIGCLIFFMITSFLRLCYRGLMKVRG